MRVNGRWISFRLMHRALFVGLLAVPLGASAGFNSRAADSPETANDPICAFAPATNARGRVPGLIVGAVVLLPGGTRSDYGVQIRFNGSIGAVGEFDVLRTDFPDAAVLDCRGKAELSPGFVNAHEHPAYSYALPDPNSESRIRPQG